METVNKQSPIGNCKKCGDFVYEELSLDYKGICNTCEENLYSFEILPLTIKT